MDPLGGQKYNGDCWKRKESTFLFFPYLFGLNGEDIFALPADKSIREICLFPIKTFSYTALGICCFLYCIQLNRLFLVSICKQLKADEGLIYHTRRQWDWSVTKMVASAKQKIYCWSLISNNTLNLTPWDTTTRLRDSFIPQAIRLLNAWALLSASITQSIHLVASLEWI